MSKPEALVVGGGLKGLVAARRLIDRGYKVRLVEKGPAFGGVMSSMAWDGFNLDIGCHLFPNDEDKITALHLDLMDGAVEPIHPEPAAYYNGVLSTGMEYPDFSTLPAEVRGAALADLLDVAARRTQPAAPPSMDVTLADYLDGRFGARVGALIGAAHEKILGAKASALASPAWNAITARRAKIVDDAVAAELKTVPAFDDVILMSNVKDTMRFHRDQAGKFNARLFYPAHGGMGGFTASAVRRLKSLGAVVTPQTDIASLQTPPGAPVRVTTKAGEQFEVDLVMWTTGAESLSAALGVSLAGRTIVSLPMVLFYFDVPEETVAPHTWINVFDASVRATRVSAPSRYASGNAPAGRAYICAEATARLDEDFYLNPDAHAARIWDEIVRIGFAQGPLPDHRLTRKTPVSFRHPLKDYAHARAALDRRLESASRILEIEDWVFSKTECVRAADRKLDALEHV